MANVHTLDRREPPAAPDGLAWLLHPPGGKHPREENFGDMLRLNIFPQFRALSFTAAMMCVFVAVFAAQAATGGLVLGGALLQVSPGGLTALCTASYASVVGGRGLHRLLLAGLLHRNFEDLFGTLVTFLVWVSWVERIFGPARTALIFAAGSAVGLACCVSIFRREELLGATVGQFALMGSSIGFMLYHWQQLSAFHLFCVAQIFLVVFPFAVAYASSGNLASFTHSLVGVLLGLLLGVGLAPALGQGNAFRARVRYAALGLVLAALAAALLTAFLA